MNVRHGTAVSTKRTLSQPGGAGLLVALAAWVFYLLITLTVPLIDGLLLWTGVGPLLLSALFFGLAGAVLSSLALVTYDLLLVAFLYPDLLVTPVFIVGIVAPIAFAFQAAIIRRFFLERQRHYDEYRILADFAYDSEFWIGPDGQMIYQSPSVERLTGYTAQELVDGHPDLFRSLVHPDDLERLYDFFYAPVPERGANRVEFRITHRNGEERWIETTNTLVHDRHGNFMGMRGSSRDITEQRHYYEQMRAALAEKELLIREIHHRVKNNLAIVASLLNLKGNLDGPGLTGAEVMDLGARIRSIAMVHNQLYERGNLVNVDAHEYLESLAYEVHASLQPRDAEITLDLDIDPLRTSMDVAVPLGLIATELLTNAMKYAFRGRGSGRLTVSLQNPTDGRTGDEPGSARDGADTGADRTQLRASERSGPCFAVEDDGVGLGATDFADPDTLGMQLIQNLAEQLHATLNIESDQGTRVSLTLPAGVVSE